MELLQDRGAAVAYNDPHVPTLPPLRGPLDPAGEHPAHGRDPGGAGLRPDRDRPQGLRLAGNLAARDAGHRHPRGHPRFALDAPAEIVTA